VDGMRCIWNGEIETAVDMDNNYCKSSLHTIAPYVGKLRPEIVHNLIENYSNRQTVVFDPFCGSGTVPLEAWIMGRDTIGVDLNYYAYVISRAKLFPYSDLNAAIKQLSLYESVIRNNVENIDINVVPDWIKEFFHPSTLAEIVAWKNILIQNNDFFILACLLGILHHQRPGFLSYPSSNGAPYLRSNKYPISQYPEMYEYRNVYDRLRKKIERAYKNTLRFDFQISRKVIHSNTLDYDLIRGDTTIITSPPYMKSLTYARDNRMRLWFLGHDNWKSIDKKISIGKNEFGELMEKCFFNWSIMQSNGSYCIVVVGDILYDSSSNVSIPNMICNLAEKCSYKLIDTFSYPVNQNRKFVKTESKIETEIICIFRREK
jgi:hypothetical protein